MVIKPETKSKSFKSIIKRLKPIIFFVILYFVFLFCFSCSYKKEVPPPPDLIEESKMAQVISDISITEAILTNEPLASMNDSIKKINVLKEHGLTSRQFLSSMKYYSENPLKLQGIYEEVEKIISSKQSPADTTKKK
jgi:hypothetical protein